MEITITDRVMRMLRANTRAGYKWKQTGRQVADGMWAVSFDEETIARLEEVRLAGESHNDAIERLIAGLAS